MAQRKRLTVDGPRSAYSKLLTQTTSVENENSESGIGRTPMQRQYVERIDSEGESSLKGPEHVRKSQIHVPARSRQTRMESRDQIHVPALSEQPRKESSDPVCRDSLGEDAVHEAQPRPQQANAYNRLYLESLKKQVKDQGDTIALLQKAQTIFLHQSAELPRHCRWECIAKVLTDIVSLTLLGPGLDSQLYPSEEELIPKILGAFNICMDMQDEVEMFLTEWGKGGKANIQMKVNDNIRGRRGSILRTMREEFYLQIGLPRPRKTEPEERRLVWKQQLLALKHGHTWRVEHGKDSMDPWGSIAVHHSISKVLFGVRYDTKAAIHINLKQAGFFFYNLELAIDGDVMDPGRMLFHLRKMAEMEERVKNQFMKDMKRVFVAIS